MVAYSFTDWDGVSPELDYDGRRELRRDLHPPGLFEVFFVSGYYLAASVVQIVLALYFATILSFNVRFRNFFKGVLFFPYLINGVAIGFVFLYFFQDGGTLDSVLSLFGVQTDHAWLGTPASANTSLAGVSVWRYLGLNFVLFLGAIQSIPGELYEAAELDGANRWHQFRHIIAPGIKPVLSPDRDPVDLRLAVGLRDPVHHDRRRDRHRDLRDPDRASWPSVQQDGPRLGGRGRAAADRPAGDLGAAAPRPRRQGGPRMTRAHAVGPHRSSSPVRWSLVATYAWSVLLSARSSSS